MLNSTALFYNACLKSTLVFGAGLLLSWTLRRQSAAVRYFLWTAVLAAALALPIVETLLDRADLRLQPAAAAAILVDAPALVNVPAAQAPAAPRPFPLAQAIFLAWAAGLAGSLAWLAIGHRRIGSIRGRARVIERRDWHEILDACRRRLGSTRPVALLSSELVDVPLSYGLANPAILLPATADRWDHEKRTAVLMHELTHIHRHDPLWSFLARCAVAVYWFHPLAWLALARHRREQERSCDDAVLTAGIRQSEYAGHLMSVAQSARRWEPAQGMAAGRDFEDRLRAILDPSGRRASLSRGAALAGLAMAAAVLIPLAAMRAQSNATASVTGSVYDASGAAVPKANILLKRTDGPGEEVAQADLAGEFKFDRIRSGHYDAEVRAPGFAVLRQSGLSVAEGAAARQDFHLALGSVNESLDVVGHRPAPLAVPQRTPQRIRVGGNVQATRLVHRLAPAYPANAMAAGISGTVLLRAVISTEGSLLNLSVLNTVDADLATAAMDAVRQWRYQPTLLNGVPVEVATTISVNFTLQ